MAPARDFEKNIFINCPFDPAYRALIRPLLFTILYFGFNPRVALERSDSAEQRLDKICELIASAKYSIHDLSRSRSQTKNEFARHNMPFELGIDYGCRKFGGKPMGEKKFLILEKEKYDYSRAISDISGIDIQNHDDDPETLMRVVRDWFLVTVGVKGPAPASVIWNDFNGFSADFDRRRRREGFRDKDIYDMGVPEFSAFIREWLDRRRRVVRFR